jgi:hypothetical protein
MTCQYVALDVPDSGCPAPAQPVDVVLPAAWNSITTIAEEARHHRINLCDEHRVLVDRHGDELNYTIRPAPGTRSPTPTSGTSPSTGSSQPNPCAAGRPAVDAACSRWVIRHPTAPTYRPRLHTQHRMLDLR